MAIKSYHDRLRALLRENPAGLPVSTLADRLGAHRASIYNSLNSMPDAYIKEWEWTDSGRKAAIWAVVTVPANAAVPPQGV